MNNTIIRALIGVICLLSINSSVKAQSKQATLELSIRQVVVTEGVAAITGPAVNREIALFDNLGKELLLSGRSDSQGMAEFTLDEKFPLSGRDLFYTNIKVDGIDNGVFTCQAEQICRMTAFSVDGLDPELDDGILIVRIVKSEAMDEPAGNEKVTVWPADENNIPLLIPYKVIGRDSHHNQVIADYSGVPCISNEEGYCAAYLDNYFRWGKSHGKVATTNTVVKLRRVISHDASYNAVPENGLFITKLAIDGKGELDDCFYKTPPTRGTINQYCLEKRYQSATAQAALLQNTEDISAYNQALIHASWLSKDTLDLFAGFTPDEGEVSALIDTGRSGSFDSGKQVKIILHVRKITHDGYNAAIGDAAIGKQVLITQPDDPARLLGACIVNTLGECVVNIDRSRLQSPDGFIKFRVLADDFDNGILICSDDQECEQFAYTAAGLSGYQDAILLYKVVNKDNYREPVSDIVITAGKYILKAVFLGGDNYSAHKYSRGCTSDENGACPIYVAETGFVWEQDDSGVSVIPNVWVNDLQGNDLNYPHPREDQLVVYHIAVDKSGSLDDCTFTSPLKYDSKAPVCKQKKIALQTAMALYTATPTITNTPLPTQTPVPTATLVPSPTPAPGLPEIVTSPTVIGAGIFVILVVLVGGAWLIFRSRKTK